MLRKFTILKTKLSKSICIDGFYKYEYKYFYNMNFTNSRNRI